MTIKGLDILKSKNHQKWKGFVSEVHCRYVETDFERSLITNLTITVAVPYRKKKVNCPFSPQRIYLLPFTVLAFLSSISHSYDVPLDSLKVSSLLPFYSVTRFSFYSPYSPFPLLSSINLFCRVALFISPLYIPFIAVQPSSFYHISKTVQLYCSSFHSFPSKILSFITLFK